MTSSASQPLVGPWRLTLRELGNQMDVLAKAPKGQQELESLLDEGHELHQGRSSEEVGRIRGYAMTCLARQQISSGALLPVLAELQNGRHGYLVASAARALRSADRSSGYAPYLVAAVRRFALHDLEHAIDELEIRWPSGPATTVTAEALNTLAWLGSDAYSVLTQLGEIRWSVPLADATSERLDRTIQLLAMPASTVASSCCHTDAATQAVRMNQSTAFFADTPVQDQDGTETRFGAFFPGKPAVVAFFYTRCDNPNKCSLTITRLAALQRRLNDEGLATAVRLAAITYDPLWDIATRLRDYGTNRGMVFGENVKALRAPDSAGLQLLDYLGATTARSGGLVMSHRVELLVLDKNATVRFLFSRVHADHQEVFAALREVMAEPLDASSGSHTGPRRRSLPLGPLASVALVIAPKCPACVLTYLSAVGAVHVHHSASAAGHSRFLLPALMLYFAVLAFGAHRARRLIPLLIGGAGALLSASSFLQGDVKLSGLGNALMLLAPFLQAHAFLTRADRVKVNTLRQLVSKLRDRAYHALSSPWIRELRRQHSGRAARQIQK